MAGERRATAYQQECKQRENAEKEENPGAIGSYPVKRLARLALADVVHAVPRYRGLRVGTRSGVSAGGMSDLFDRFEPAGLRYQFVRNECVADKKKGLSLAAKPFVGLVGRVGFEPTTDGLRVHCSTN